MAVLPDLPIFHQDDDMHQRPYERLIVWQEAHRLFLWVNSIVETFPAIHQFALADQMRRSACSIPMNIVEGISRRTRKEKRRYLDIAISSLEELHCQMRMSLDLEYVTKEIFMKGDAWVNRVSFLLVRLHQSLR